MRFATGGLTIGLFSVWGLTQLEAAPLDFKQVAGDAKWVGHVDVDAMRESKVVQNAYHRAQEKHPQMAMAFEFGSKMLGMDVRSDLHGITVYGKEVGKESGVMLVNAKVDREKLSMLADKARDHKVEDYGDYKLHSWTQKHHNKTKTVAGTFYADGIIFADSLDALKDAINVLEGKSSGVSDSSELAGRVPPGTTVLARITGISDAELKHDCPIAKQTKSFRFVVGENDGKSFYRAKAEMTNEDAANNVQQIVEGIRALGMLHANEKDKKLVASLNAKHEGNTTTVLWSGSADDVWEQIEKHAKKFEEMRAKHREHRKDWRKDSRGKGRHDDDRDDDDDDKDDDDRGDRKRDVEDF